MNKIFNLIEFFEPDFDPRFGKSAFARHLTLHKYPLEIRNEVLHASRVIGVRVVRDQYKATGYPQDMVVKFNQAIYDNSALLDEMVFWIGFDYVAEQLKKFDTTKTKHYKLVELITTLTKEECSGDLEKVLKTRI